MKKYLILSIISALCVIITPVGMYGTGKNRRETMSYSVSDDGNIQNMGNAVMEDIVRVFNSETDTVMELNFRDYIIGVVAGEMPVEFHSEALSAGAVAAATLTRKKMSTLSDGALSETVISTDPAKHQAYMATDEMKERWGENFEEYYKKLCDAVDASIGYNIVYDGEIITAVYHSVSTGLTENAQNVWAGAAPYLVSVESEGDVYSPKYASSLEVSFDEFRRCLTENGAKPSEDNSVLISSAEYTEAGRIKTITAGGKEFTGEQFRQMFSLRSAAVTYEITDSGIILDVKGYGHGVGLSQYGADYYARQGMTWQEIIKHYYTGVDIVPVTMG
ncbi:MAG: stage II sporulation protein D [Clostridia bacterium]|nr:stage II sporulation protein D [Clostridia bacterium]